MKDAALSEALDEFLNEDRVKRWVRHLGVDADDRARLLDAAAIGITVRWWRNTELEGVHPGELANHKPQEPGEADDEYDRRIRSIEDAHWDELDVDAATFTHVADPGEQSRLGRIFEGVREGYGIPDDVMMRMNVATTLQVREVLDTVTFDDRAWWEDVFGLLTDYDRPMQVGCSQIRAHDVFDEDAWIRYGDDVADAASRAAVFTDMAGAETALLLSAHGMMHARHWFLSPVWVPAVNRLRDAVGNGEAMSDRRDYITVHPSVDDEAFWDALKHRPHLLNGCQADWVIKSVMKRTLIWQAYREDGQGFSDDSVEQGPFDPLI